MRNLYDLILNLPAKQYTLVSTIIGFALIDDLTALEQNTLGNFLMLIGQILETNSAQEQLLQNKISKKEHIKNIKDIEKIKKYLQID